MEKYASIEYAALPDGRERLRWAWEAFVDLDGVTKFVDRKSVV